MSVESAILLFACRLCDTHSRRVLGKSVTDSGGLHRTGYLFWRQRWPFRAYVRFAADTCRSQCNLWSLDDLNKDALPCTVTIAKQKIRR